MNDYYNDPPDYPEVPQCCGEEMEVGDDGNCKCLVCGAVIVAQPDIEPMEEWKCDKCGEKYPCRCEESHYVPEECPHGKDWGNCDACDYASDIAFDAARESRYK